LAWLQSTIRRACRPVFASTNYDADSINEATELLAKTGLQARLMVDCSHANSRRQHQNQMEVGQTLSEQLAGGDERIIGVMIESHLVAGRQNVVEGKPLTYGQSITDACLGWEDTQPLLDHFADAIRARRSRLRASA